jgi:hypothetical protein
MLRFRVGSEATTNRTLGPLTIQNVFGKALPPVYIASHHAQQAVNGESATAIGKTKAINLL